MEEAFAVARVSSREQSEGYSLDSQDSRIDEYANRRNLKIVKKWQIVESANKNDNRKKFQEIIDEFKKSNVKHIIFEKVDRVARNFKDIVIVQELIEIHNKQFHYIRENIILHSESRSSEKLNFDIQAILAKNYISNLSDEVKKGMEEKISQGIWSALAPAGYVNDSENKRIIIDSRLEPYIKKAFVLYASGTNSLTKVVSILEKEGLRKINKRPLSKARLHLILQNPFYIGKLPWKGKLYPGIHEPMISEELFNKVQEVLKRKAHPRKIIHNFEFSGLIKCGICGASFTSDIQKGKYVYYRCTQNKFKHPNVYWKEEKLEEEVGKILGKLVLPESIHEVVVNALKESHKYEAEFHSKAISTLSTNLTKTQNQKETVYEDKLEGLITKEVYLEKFEN